MSRSSSRGALVRGMLVTFVGAGACGGSAAPVTPTSLPTPFLLLPVAGTSIAACGSVGTPGAYTVTSDIGTGSTARCLIVASSGVTLDCHNHRVNGIVEISDNLSNVSLQNCQMSQLTTGNNLVNSTIAGSSTSTGISIQNAIGLIFDHNTILMPAQRASAAITLVGGSQNLVTNNVIDGGYHGQDLTGQGGDAPGADDGIVLADVMNDTVSGNTIRNVWDAGIEGVNAIWNTTIANNTIGNAIEAGISSYYCTSWQNDTISGNNVSQSQHALFFYYVSDSHCFAYPNLRTPIGSFSTNVIASNVFRSPLGTAQLAMSLVFHGALPDVVVTENVIRGNDFGSADVTVAPQSGFTNGGGNSCGTQGTFAC